MDQLDWLVPFLVFFVVLPQLREIQRVVVMLLVRLGASAEHDPSA